MDRQLIVVARSQLALCDYLRAQFCGDRDVEVILDRRWGERRQRVQAHEPERRRADRRQGPPREGDLRTHGFAVIHRRPEAMGLREIEKPLGELHTQIVGKPQEDPAGDGDAQASVQTQTIERTSPVWNAGQPNGNGIGKGRTNGPTQRVLSEDRSVTISNLPFEEGGQEWQEVLKKIGIEGLRFPNNGTLCAPWRKFLNELRAAATLGESASMPGLVSSMGSANAAAPRGTGAGDQAAMAVEMTARENKQSDTNGNETRVKIQALKPGTGPDTVRYLFIVSRDQPEVYKRLTRDFAADKEVQVILDRRVGERRQRAQGNGLERRRASRRRQPEGWIVPVSQLYRGDRPCFVRLGQDPISKSTARRGDGSSFFAPPKASAKRALEGLKGVTRADASLRDKEARVLFDPAAELQRPVCRQVIADPRFEPAKRNSTEEDRSRMGLD